MNTGQSHAKFKLGEERERQKRREGKRFEILQLAGFNFPPF